MEADLVEVIVQNEIDATWHFAHSIRQSNESLRETLSRQAESAPEINPVLYVDRDDATVVASSDGRYDGRSLSAIGYSAPSDSLEGDDVSVSLRVDEGTTSWVFATVVDAEHTLLVQVDLDVMAAELDPSLNGTRTRVVNSEGLVMLDTKTGGRRDTARRGAGRRFICRPGGPGR